MEVKVASALGFCKGVSHSLEKVRMAYAAALEKGVSCYIYGDIVHNGYVVNELERNGIRSISSPDEAEPGILVIRAHGISDSERDAFVSAGFEIVDATCPVVLKNQSLIRNSEKSVIIFGTASHAEVVALSGSGASAPLVLSGSQDLDKIDPSLSYNAILQTTFSEEELVNIRKAVSEKGLSVEILNDICNASRLRRAALHSLVEEVDAVVVVGDKRSANTNELARIAREGGKAGFLVESFRDIPIDVLEYEKVGLTAGASTPSVIYREVEEALRRK